MSAERMYAPTRNRLQFRLRTSHRWLTGSFATGQRRLTDLLNGEESATSLTADDLVAYQEWPAPERTGRAVGSASLCLQTILFAVPVEDAPRQPDIRIRSTRRLTRVLVGVGPYEVEGDLYLLPETRPRDLLSSVSTRFIVLAEASIRQVGQPGAQESGGVVLVNRQHVDFMGPVTGQ